MKRTVAVAAMILCSLSTALADLVPPDKPKKTKSVDTSLVIRLDAEAKEARLVIPRDQLKQLRAQIDEVSGDDETASATTGFGRTQTLVSGALLSLAFVFGGLWFVRTRPQNSRAVVTMAALLALGSIANLVYGNAGPPPAAREITGKMFTQSVHTYKQGSGKIKLEVSDDARTPQLIVPDPPRPNGE